MKILEKDIQKTIIEYLLIKRVFHFRNNSGAMSGTYKGKGWFMRFGAPGSPDIICVIKGQFVGIEVKVNKGIQSRAQYEFQVALEKAGGRYLLVRSLKEVMEAL